MNGGILTVMKKEFARFFGDRRMLIMVLLPGIMIYVVYSFMGTAMKSMFSPDEDHTPTAYTVNMPDSIRPLAGLAGLEINDIAPGEVAGIKDDISQKNADICLVFPEDFDAQVAVFDIKTSAGAAPNIEIFYNSVDTNSSNTYGIVMTLLNEYQSSLAKKFDINRGVQDNDLATQEDASASIISSMMPLLLMIFLYSGCIGLAPESIAGEKERGTIATLLVTPLKRSELAIGKILSLGVLSFLSGLVSAVATIASLPKLMGGSEDMLSVSIYSPVDYLCLALIILSTILLLVTVISIISAFAKTVKEAGTMVVPLMIVVMLVGVTGMFGGGAQSESVYYFLPLYGSVQGMIGIFSLEYSAVNVVIACLGNLAYACIGGFVLTKMFNSEKIMFSN